MSFYEINDLNKLRSKYMLKTRETQAGDDNQFQWRFKKKNWSCVYTYICFFDITSTALTHLCCLSSTYKQACSKHLDWTVNCMTMVVFLSFCHVLRSVCRFSWNEYSAILEDSLLICRVLPCKEKKKEKKITIVVIVHFLKHVNSLFRYFLH